MSTLKFKTNRLAEECSFVWEIPNFTTLHDAKSPDNDNETISVPAGESVDLPSTWTLGLAFTTGGDIGLYFHLTEGPEESIYANFCASVNYPNKDLDGVSGNWSLINEHEGGVTIGWRMDDFLTLEKLKTVGILDNDSDTLRIHVRLVIYAEGMPTPTSTPTPSCSDEILQQNAGVNRMTPSELLKSGKYSDFVIQVKDLDSAEFIKKKVHRNVLSIQSPVFEALFESQMLEKEAGVVTIEDLSPTGLDILLEFMYAGNIPDTWKSVPEQVLNAAEKYHLPLLKDQIGKRLHEAATPENAVSLFTLSKKHELPDAMRRIRKFIKANIDEIYLNKI